MCPTTLINDSRRNIVRIIRMYQGSYTNSKTNHLLKMGVVVESLKSIEIAYEIHVFCSLLL